jgi:hypothetical protein
MRSRSWRKIALLVLALALFSSALWLGAWWLQGYVSPSLAVRNLLRSEPIHIAAHLVLYGALYTICRALVGPSNRLGIAPAVMLTLAIAFVQEMVQVRTYRRTFAEGELFDLAVDTVAITAVELWLRRGTKQR